MMQVVVVGRVVVGQVVVVGVERVLVNLVGEGEKRGE